MSDLSSSPMAIHSYAASVRCIPSQLTYEETSSQTLDCGVPQGIDRLKLYGPPDPQQAFRPPPLNPAPEDISIKRLVSCQEI